MIRLHRLSKRHFLSAALVAVGLPLAVLLGLQYRSLVRLEHLSGVAQRATLDNYAEAVAGEVRALYERSAERALNLPASVFTEPCYESAGFHFKKKGAPGARSLFLVNFRNGDWGRMVFFDPRGERIELDPHSDQYRAIFVAASSWSVVGRKGIPVGPTALSIDERDPDHRIVLNPVTEAIDAETARVVGLAGMVIDSGEFVDELLPPLVERALPKFFPDARSLRPAVRVTDAAGTTVYSSSPEPLVATTPPGGTVVRRPFPFLFTDWEVEVVSDGAAAERLARHNFFLNVSLSAVLGLALLAGVVLALRTAARAVHLSQMKSDFVSNVSHELRTPVASIRAFGELLALGRAGPDRVTEYGGRIEAESRRLTALINNILDFSKIESGAKTYDFEVGDVGEVVDSVLETFETRLDQKGFEVEVVRPPALLPAVRHDPQALAQVFTNLLDNAIKYSAIKGPGASHRLTVAFERRSGRVGIAVRDRGVGIPGSEQGRIFERFHRVAADPDDALVHDVKGSGLGLALVDQIVRAHGGEVTVASEPGEGSVFTVWLPTAEAAEEVRRVRERGRGADDRGAGEVVPEG